MKIYKQEELCSLSPHSSRLRIITMMVRRRLQLFSRDKTDLWVTLGQAPVMVGAFFIVFQVIVGGSMTESFQPLISYPAPSIIIFLVTISAIWFGTAKAITEIPGDVRYFTQEKLSFLTDTDYIISRFISLVLISWAQMLIFVVSFHLLFIVIPSLIFPWKAGIIAENGQAVSFYNALMVPMFLELIVLMGLIVMASVVLGMLVSTFMQSRAAANAILPFYLIVHILFGGSPIQTVQSMIPTSYSISQIILSRWGFEAVMLLFERELVRNTPRGRADDGFRNNANLKFSELFRSQGGVRIFLTQLKQTGHVALASDPATQEFWLQAVDETQEIMQAHGNTLSYHEHTYINNLKSEQDSEPSTPSPKKFVVDVMPEFLRLYGNILEKIVLKVDDGLSLDFKEQKLWQEMVHAKPKIIIFRPPHEVTTWWVITMFTLLGLVALWAVFKIKSFLSRSPLTRRTTITSKPGR